jgi:REP element-mobilizing transposase RayT
MAQTLAKILIHLVYSTKGRQPLLPHDPFPELHKFARGIFVDRKCHMIEMNNVADHVHILFDLHRTEALANVVMHVKKGTSRWLKSLLKKGTGSERPLDFAQRIWVAATCLSPFSTPC